ncbi:MAG: hypothetical protein Fur006_50940 [Coleofasciculaceae cyanobacterium]
MSAKMRTRLRNLFPILIGLYTPLLIVVLIIVLIGFQLSIPMADLTRDPSAITDTNPFLGALSNIGVLSWCATVAICLFTFALLNKKPFTGEFSAFLLGGGLISLILLLDDLFLFHETVFPLYFNIPEKIVFLSYGLILLGYITRFRKLISETDFIFLIFAFVFFGFSMVIDLLDLRISALFEDGSKLFGIVSWLGYFARTCFQVIKYALLQPTENNEERFS